MKYDLNDVAALLLVHEKATGHPRLKPLADAAMAQLEKYADEHKKPIPEILPGKEPEPTQAPEDEELTEHDEEGEAV